jgi:hypothetical protein
MPRTDSGEWVTNEVQSGADPDDFTFYPQPEIVQEPGKGSATEECYDAIFSRPRRRG